MTGAIIASESLVSPSSSSPSLSTSPPPSPSSILSKTDSYVRSALANRDASHGYTHAVSVSSNASAIMRLSPKFPELPFTDLPPTDIVKVAAMLHDVADHKYLSREGPGVKASLDAFMSSTFSPKDVLVIHSIIDNISFSAESKGKLDLNLLPPFVLMLRHIVSDADKIEALGPVGLTRCYSYSKEINPTGSEDDHWRHVAVHCDEKLLRLRGEYIRTEGGKKLSEQGHEFLRKWREEVGSKYVEVEGGGGKEN
ncbi:hypothetical protein TrCOL_g4923 [Triparma columacea]|uniref:HD/PDEase domain-containing protein n=1 Tax=Triparma columacea TaxID=722753 RepID=A0A9W7GEB5_9STRA|nr:hypothetical protein TrCOL_g4923 [Triparma columacea]